MKNDLLLFVSNIAGLNTGRGGHYYTVVDHFQFFSNHYNVKIVCIGHEIPQAFKGIESDIFFILYKTIFDAPKAILAMRRLLEKGPSVGNAFDSNSFLFARIAGMESHFPLYFTKCGGAVRKGYTPAGHPDVVFHGEDLEHYKLLGQPNAGRTLWMIPNRVAANTKLQSKPAHLSLFPQGGFNILRIARVCRKYSESIQQTINLARELRTSGIVVSLVVIGYPEDDFLVNEFRSQLEGLGELHLSDEITTNASRHLVEADLVVASGRGVMESAMLGKITLISSKGGRFPVLLTSEIFQEAIYSNFSDRFTLQKQQKTIAEVEDLLNNPDSLKSYLSEILSLSQEYFSLDSVLGKYQELYSRERAGVLIYSYKDIFIHSCKFIIECLIRKFAR